MADNVSDFNKLACVPSQDLDLNLSQLVFGELNRDLYESLQPGAAGQLKVVGYPPSNAVYELTAQRVDHSLAAILNGEMQPIFMSYTVPCPGVGEKKVGFDGAGRAQRL